MTDAALDLQQSVFKTLSADETFTQLLGENRIYDKIPERSPFPYLVLGRSSSSDWSTSTEGGETVTFFIHLWSKQSSRTQSHAILARMKTLMSGSVEPLQDNHLINLRFQLAETRRDRTTGHFHSVARFKAVLEPIE